MQTYCSAHVGQSQATARSGSDACLLGLRGRHARRRGAGSDQVDGQDQRGDREQPAVADNRSASGARRTSMKYLITNRTLTAAMSMMATVATSGVTEFFDSNHVDAQVASINAAHTIVTGLRSSSTTHLTRYSSGNRMIQSRSTMCQ